VPVTFIAGSAIQSPTTRGFSGKGEWAMTIKSLVQVLSVLVIALPSWRIASATSNLFTPVSGSAFVSSDNSPFIVHAGGEVRNTDTVNARTVEASLGHAQGGSNGFTVYGYNPGALVFNCWLTITPDNGASGTLVLGETTTPGYFSLYITNNQPSGNYFYSMRCDIPHVNGGVPAAIFGVRPDH
jgi:hypothetical protein